MWRTRFGLAALGLLVAAVSAPAQAQGGPGGRRGPDLDQQMAMLTERLELTGEQAKSVRAILEMQGDRRREVFQASRGDRAAMRAAMQEVQEETNALLADVLTEAQMKKYQEFQAELRQRRRPPPR